MFDLPCREDYTYEKFILYLYLVAAYADYQIDDAEINIIREKMDKMKLVKKEDFNKCWHEVLNDFRRHNDLDSLQHIEGCVKSLHLDADARHKVYRDMKDIIRVDGEEEETERVMLFRLKKTLRI